MQLLLFVFIYICCYCCCCCCCSFAYMNEIPNIARRKRKTKRKKDKIFFVCMCVLRESNSVYVRQECVCFYLGNFVWLLLIFFKFSILIVSPERKWKGLFLNRFFLFTFLLLLLLHLMHILFTGNMRQHTKKC